MNKKLRPPAYGNAGLGFVMPGATNNFGFSEIIEKIGSVVGVVIAGYGYTKLIIIGYRYSQQLISKFKERRRKKKYNSELFRKQVQFFIISYICHPSVHKIRSIYMFAIT